MRHLFFFGFLLLLTGCNKPVSDGVASSTGKIKELELRTTQLEERINDVELKIMSRDFDSYLEGLSSSVFDLSEKWCKFRVEHWDSSQNTFKSMIDRYAEKNGTPDTTMVPRIEGYLELFNQHCRSNLIWNPR